MLLKILLIQCQHGFFDSWGIDNSPGSLCATRSSLSGDLFPALVAGRELHAVK